MNLRQQIIEDHIDTTSSILKIGEDKSFQIFAHSLFTDKSIHSYNENDNVDGGQDKQIDMITIDDYGDEATVYITQIKNEDTFSSNAVIQIRNGLNWILNKRKNDIQSLTNIKFKDKIEEYRNFQNEYGRSNINIKVAYITKGLTDILSDECIQERKTILDEYDNDTFNSVTFEFIGAIELVDIISSQEKKNKKIDTDLKILYDTNKPSLITYHSKGLKGIICTTTANEIAKIILNDKHGFVFDLNIRRFLGKGRGVNKEILQTCTDIHSSHLFWFLNNGITIVCDKVDPVPDPDNAFVKIKNLQIVNGCQTASTLALALDRGDLDSDTRVLLRIYETENLDLVDKIVLTTNNQNVISSRNLRANDKQQIDLERGFKIYGYFFERKPRQFDSAIDKSLIIPNDLAAVSYLAIVLKRPSDARSRKYKVWSEYYLKIFNGKIVEPYLLSSLIYNSVNLYLLSNFNTESDYNKRYLAKNASFHIARMTAFQLLDGDTWTNKELLSEHIEKLVKNKSILDDIIDDTIEELLEMVKANNKFINDLNTALKSAELDLEINKSLFNKKNLRKGAKKILAKKK